MLDHRPLRVDQVLRLQRVRLVMREVSVQFQEKPDQVDVQ